MLASRIHVSTPSETEPEDIFQSSLAVLFSDDTQSSHGNPGDSLIYRSPCYGNIKIFLSTHPDVHARRQLFAHYLWNAGILVADMIERASSCDESVVQHGPPYSDQSFWDVRGEGSSNLELVGNLPL
jgi:hypothetical protein